MRPHIITAGHTAIGHQQVPLVSLLHTFITVTALTPPPEPELPLQLKGFDHQNLSEAKLQLLSPSGGSISE